MSTPDETTNPAAAFTEAEVEAAALVAVEVSNKFAPADYRDMIRAALAAVAQSHHDRAVAEGEREVAELRAEVVDAREYGQRFKSAARDALKGGRKAIEAAELIQTDLDVARAEVTRLAGAVERVEAVANDPFDGAVMTNERFGEGFRAGEMTTFDRIRAALTPATESIE